MTVDPAALLPLTLLDLHVKFPDNAMAHVELVFRMVHFVAGFAWVGMLFFFNLVNVPLMKELDAPTKGKVIPKLMPRALWWFRWGAVVTVLAGVLYFLIFLMTDARNIGQPGLAWKWFGIWFGVWAVTWAALYFPLIRPAPANGWMVAGGTTVVVFAASWLVLELIAHPDISNRSLSISVGGGMGLLMLLNVWGIIWRAQKKIIAWTAANAEHGEPIPAEAAALARQAFLASRTNFWLAFPMLFFMAASQHYPFLSGM
ncbi:MAG TPA: urate hydroxylase PuuD [Candidatus Acidoferrales bacterium]